MKLRYLVRSEAYRRPLNPGAAGSPSLPAIKETKILQQYNPESKSWEDIPVVLDDESRKKAEQDKKAFSRRGR